MHHDYFLPRDGPEEPTITCVVSKHDKSKMIFSYVLPVKGVGGEWTVKRLEQDMRRMGDFGKVIVKFDSESAVKDLRKEVANCRGNDETVLEQVPAGSSQKNGVVERVARELNKEDAMVKTWRFGPNERSQKVHTRIFLTNYSGTGKVTYSVRGKA